MANVKFKRGTHANLLALQSYDDGCFYLTTDTDRLYVALSASELVEINKSIEMVDTVAHLPTSGVQRGQFYYITGPDANSANAAASGTGGNILAVCVGFKGNGEPNWVQVNPDTVDGNDNDWVSAFSITRNAANAADANRTALIYDWAITQKDVDGVVLSDANHALSGQFSIPLQDIVSSGVSVGLSASKSGNNLVITPTGNGANSNAAVTLVLGDNIEFEASGSNYSINATDTTYTLTTNTSSKTVSLREDNTTNVGSISFAEGSVIDISVADASNNGNSTITVSHENVTRNDTSAADAELGFGDDVTVVTGVHTTDQGHVDYITTLKIVLPEETPFDITAISADNQGKLHVTYSDGVTPTTIDSGADLFFTYGAANSAASNPSVLNKGNLPVYTIAEIDAKIRELDGMTYKGVITANANLPTTQVRNGDTYKVGSSSVTVPAGNGSASGEDAKIGDLLIARGSEGTDGYISAATLVWDYIPSGDEIDTLYKITAANNNITLAPEDLNNTATSYSVGIAGGNILTASTANNTITIDHDTITTTGAMAANATAPAATQTLDFGDSFSVVVGAKADGYGHIDTIYTLSITLPDEPDLVAYTVTDTASSGTSHGNGKVTFKADNTAIGEIAFTNGNNTTAVVTRNVSEGNVNVKVDHNTLTPTYTNHTTAGNEESIDPSTGFDVISALSFDSYGHVAGYTATKIVLPDDALVTLKGNIADGSGSNANTKANIGFDLVDASGTAPYRNADGASIPLYSISTSSLKIATTAATSTTPADIAIDIEWGTF